MKTKWVNINKTLDGAYNSSIPVIVPEPENKTCPAVGYQSISVCVPVKVEPFAKPGVTVTKCCGKPTVKSGIEPCPGTKDGACFFTISQSLCVEVPVEFGAEATVGAVSVDCVKSSAEDICAECDPIMVRESVVKNKNCGCK